MFDFVGWRRLLVEHAATCADCPTTRALQGTTKGDGGHSRNVANFRSTISRMSFGIQCSLTLHGNCSAGRPNPRVGDDGTERHRPERVRLGTQHVDDGGRTDVSSVCSARGGGSGQRHLLVARRPGQPARAEPPGTGRRRHRRLRSQGPAGDRQAADRRLGGRGIRQRGAGGAQPDLRGARPVRQHGCAHRRQHPPVRPGRPAVRAQRRVRGPGPARPQAGRTRRARAWSAGRPTASGCSR